MSRRRSAAEAPARAGRSLRALGLSILGGIGLAVATASAHPLAPALLEIRELSGGEAAIHFRTSLVTPVGVDLRPQLPESCRDLTPAEAREEGSGLSLRWTVDCGPGSWVGRRVAIQGLEDARIDALLRIDLADGRVLNTILRDGEPSFTVPEKAGRGAVLRAYTRLGVEHILSGFDHLLFVLGLMLLVTAPRALLATITSFTLGHSVTLSLVALGFARVPSRAVEVAISASVYLLAVEIARPPSARPGWLRRAPWLMAIVFGLLHGMGFAGALAEVGLPAGEIPVALFAFNAGIEIGQLLFVVAVLVLRWALRDRMESRPLWSRWVPAYTIGSLAAWWSLERAAAFFGG